MTIFRKQNMVQTELMKWEGVNFFQKNTSPVCLEKNKYYFCTRL